MFAIAHPRRLAHLPLLLILVALIAAACSDNDFDDAPDDRGALAGERVGATTNTAADTEADQATPADPPDADSGNIEDGADSIAFGNELFFANGCNVCHGDTGEGGIGPAIAKTSLTLDEVISQYRSPRGIMPPFAENRISDDEVANLYAFLQSLE